MCQQYMVIDVWMMNKLLFLYLSIMNLDKINIQCAFTSLLLWFVQYIIGIKIEDNQLNTNSFTF